MKKTLKIVLFRMWAAGAVCFFAAWGRSGSEDAGTAFSVNLIAGLIAVMVIADLLIVNPLVRLANGKRLMGEEKKGVMLFLSLPLHIVKVTALILLIVATYYFLNVLSIRIFKMDETSVPVPLEPILFGIFYGLYWLLFDIIAKIFNKE